MTTSYFVELDQNDITWLAWAAGLAVGSNNAMAGQTIGGILERIQAIEFPDQGNEDMIAPDFDPDLPHKTETEDWPDEAPAGEPERVPDPQFTPPPPMPPINDPKNFGAGPPPRV